MIPAERAILEVEFCNKLHTAIDLLIRNDFPEQEVANFTESVKTFLKFQDIKEYVKSALYDKANEVSKVFLVVDKGCYYSYKKFISILIALDEPEVIEMLETNFAKEKNHNNFFLLIEEKLNQKKDISNCENIFLSLMTLHNFDIELVDTFIKTIQKDRSYLIQKLIEAKSYSTLRKYVEGLAIKDLQTLRSVVPIIIEKYDDRIGVHYLDMIKTIVSYSNEFTDSLLVTRNWNLRSPFEKYILFSAISSPSLIKNYCQYLSTKNLISFAKFESSFLDTASSGDIVQYAINVPASNKRRILKRLVDLKEDDELALVAFIKKFPEYENLLPLL